MGMKQARRPGDLLRIIPGLGGTEPKRWVRFGKLGLARGYDPSHTGTNWDLDFDSADPSTWRGVVPRNWGRKKINKKN